MPYRQTRWPAEGEVCWLLRKIPRAGICAIPLLDVFYLEADARCSIDARRLFQAPVRYEKNRIGFRFEARWVDLPPLCAA